MKDYDPDKMRNIAIVGHGSCGKTSLTSAFLFDAGATTRLTTVASGNTVTDYDPDEIERQISINSAVCHMEWNGHKVNAVDCPGYMNFLWDTRASLRAVDAGIVIVCGVAGVEVGTEKDWEMMEELKRPRILVINKLDRENANYERTVKSIHNFFGRQAVPVQLPIGEEKDFRGFVDLINKAAFIFQKDGSGKFDKEEIPDSMKEIAENKIQELTEMVAENDEKLMEIYFEKGELSPDELKDGLRKSITNRQFFPILVSSALLNIGAQPILDAVVDYLPNPIQIGEVKGAVGAVKTSVDDLLDEGFLRQSES